MPLSLLSGFVQPSPAQDDFQPRRLEASLAANEHLKQAVEADPGYVPARLNLAVAYLYLGRPQQASAVLSDAHELGGDELSLKGLEALSLYESSDAGLDLWPMAVAKLEKLVASPEKLLENRCERPSGEEGRSGGPFRRERNGAQAPQERVPRMGRATGAYAVVCEDPEHRPISHHGRAADFPTASDAPPGLLFNLARLLAMRPGASEAHDYWNRLAAMGEHLPATIRAFVCQEQNAMPAASCLRHTSQDIQPSPWTWPLPSAGLERLSPEAERHVLQGWRVIPFDWFKDQLHGHIYRRSDGAGEVLEIDQFVQMQVLRGEPLGSVRALSAYCGQPLRQRTLSNGMVWSCADWAALAWGDQIRELWWVAR